MSDSNFYQSHWREIEQERLARYEDMFVYRPHHEGMIQPLGLEEGQVVVDFGCGPGFVTMEFARRVGPRGKAFGVDPNAQFVQRATARAMEASISNIEFIHVQGDRVPLDENSADRLFCKNVLEYVPDASQTLAEHYRLLKSGGKVLIVDSDWGFVAVEPWGRARTDEFFGAASGAFREPYIGRKLYGLLADAGFEDITIQVITAADTVGAIMPVVANMVSYIRHLDTMPASRVDAMTAELESAIQRKRYLFLLPQFLATATKPAAA